jgi:hypothetical protein
MEVVVILRQLWSCRLAVVCGIALATFVAVVMAFRVNLGFPPKFESRQYSIGVASSKVLVDSESSQVIDLGDGELPTDVVVALITRARLLANLIATSPLKDRIARRAGIDQGTFTAAGPSLGADGANTGSVDASPDDRREEVMTVYFDESLPIITINARAPEARTAARISSSAVTELGDHLGAIVTSDSLPDARRLVIDPLGPARFATVQRGPRRLLALIAGLFVLGLWCAGTVVVARLRAWHKQPPGGGFDDPAIIAVRRHRSTGRRTSQVLTRCARRRDASVVRTVAGRGARTQSRMRDRAVQPGAASL